MVALHAALVASGICAFSVLMGGGFVDKYELSIESLEISGGLLLLISAVKAIFPGPSVPVAPVVKHAPLQLAVSPLATPTIVSPMGVAAILIFVMLGARAPGIVQAIVISLIVILVLNFLVMFFIDFLMRIPGLIAILQLFGSVLVFIQAALAVHTTIRGLSSLVLLCHNRRLALLLSRPRQGQGH